MEPAWLETLHAQIRTRHDPWVVLEGRQAVEAALAGWWEIEGLVATDDSPWQPPVWSGLELLRRPRAELAAVAGDGAFHSDHDGVLGLARIPQETPEVAKFLAGLEVDAFVVVCPRLADPAHAGAIVRSAAALGAAAVIFGRDGVSPFEREAVQASAGALFRMPVKVADGGQVLRSLKAAGYETLGAEVGEGSVDVREAGRAEGRRALVIGAGEKGLGPFWAVACDRRIHIPLSGGMDSLGAAAASAVLLWELRRGWGRSGG